MQAGKVGNGLPIQPVVGPGDNYFGIQFMTYDPLCEVIDHSLTIDEPRVAQLRTFRRAPKLINLPGSNVMEERERLEGILNDLIDQLLNGIETNPTKLWVLTQFQPSLESVEGEDTEAREHFGMEIESIMDILGIDSSDGLLSFYLGGV